MRLIGRISSSCIRIRQYQSPCRSAWEEMRFSHAQGRMPCGVLCAQGVLNMRTAAVGLCAIVALHIFHVMADDGLGVLTNKIDAALAMPGKPVLVDNRFCGISFAERVTKRSSSTRKVRDGNGFESNPRVKLKKPFRKFTDAILTYTEHGYLENVSLVYVFPKIRDDKDMAASTKEFSEVALVIGKNMG